MVVIPRLLGQATRGSGILKGFCTLKLLDEASLWISLRSGFAELEQGDFHEFLEIQGKN